MKLKKFWSNYGNEWYARMEWESEGYAPDFVEAKGVSAKIMRNELSEADKLNGVEWAGEVSFNCTSFREHYSVVADRVLAYDARTDTLRSESAGAESTKLGWHSWETGNENDLPQWFVKLRNGRWSFTPVGDESVLRRFKPIQREQIPAD